MENVGNESGFETGNDFRRANCRRAPGRCARNRVELARGIGAASDHDAPLPAKRHVNDRRLR